MNRLGRELTSLLDHSGKVQDSTSNIWNELDGKVITRILGLVGLKVRDWTRWWKEGRTQWCWIM